MHSPPQNITHLSNFMRLLSLQCLSASPQHMKMDLGTFHGIRVHLSVLPLLPLIPGALQGTQSQSSLFQQEDIQIWGSSFCSCLLSLLNSSHTLSKWSKQQKTPTKLSKNKTYLPLLNCGKKNHISKTRYDREKLDHRWNKTHLKQRKRSQVQHLISQFFESHCYLTLSVVCDDFCDAS